MSRLGKSLISDTELPTSHRTFAEIEADFSGRFGMTLAVSAGEELKPMPASFTLTLKGHWRIAQDQPSDLATTHPAGAGDTMLVVAASAPAGRPVHLIPQ